MMLEHLRRMARYNAWANRRLYEACAELAEAEYRRPRPAFFGSIHGTLNHLLVADWIWLARIEGKGARGWSSTISLAEASRSCGRRATSRTGG